MKSDTFGKLYVCQNSGDWDRPVSEILPCKGTMYCLFSNILLFVILIKLKRSHNSGYLIQC